ncbi:MAG: hypothetical protein NC305_04020 [Lachnospiraceae bacterium]|nr:hypothetical protein [Muribaculaceae bacterium]MCM1409698.1 hypothetical protein [Lachnospiraceae bacterium]
MGKKGMGSLGRLFSVIALALLCSFFVGMDVRAEVQEITYTHDTKIFSSTSPVPFSSNSHYYLSNYTTDFSYPPSFMSNSDIISVTLRVDMSSVIGFFSSTSSSVPSTDTLYCSLYPDGKYTSFNFSFTMDKDILTTLSVYDMDVTDYFLSNVSPFKSLRLLVYFGGPRFGSSSKYVFSTNIVPISLIFEYDGPALSPTPTPGLSLDLSYYTFWQQSSANVLDYPDRDTYTSQLIGTGQHIINLYGSHSTGSVYLYTNSAGGSFYADSDVVGPSTHILVPSSGVSYSNLETFLSSIGGDINSTLKDQTGVIQDGMDKINGSLTEFPGSAGMDASKGDLDAAIGDYADIEGSLFDSGQAAFGQFDPSSLFSFTAGIYASIAALSGLMVDLIAAMGEFSILYTVSAAMVFFGMLVGLWRFFTK